MKQALSLIGASFYLLPVRWQRIKPPNIILILADDMRASGMDF